MASLLIPGDLFLPFRKPLQKCLAVGGMSSVDRAAEEAGMGITFQPVEEVLPELPALDLLEQVLFVAARMGTSTEMVCSPAMRSNFWLAAPASSLIWAVCEISPISSRKTVPPWAAQAASAAPRCPGGKPPSRGRRARFRAACWDRPSN